LGRRRTPGPGMDQRRTAAVSEEPRSVTSYRAAAGETAAALGAVGYGFGLSMRCRPGVGVGRRLPGHRQDARQSRLRRDQPPATRGRDRGRPPRVFAKPLLTIARWPNNIQADKGGCGAEGPAGTGGTKGANVLRRAGARGGGHAIAVRRAWRPCHAGRQAGVSPGGKGFWVRRRFGVT